MNAEQPRLARILGTADLTFFLVAALVNLNSIPVVAGIGPAALVFWLLGFILFFLPQGIAVLELSTRYPQEGGIYNWTKSVFGDFHGFFSGWCYWTNNIFYIPTLLFYIVGFAAYIGGPATSSLATHPVFMAGVSLVLLWLMTWVNILGLNVGKWVQTVGSAGTLIMTAVIVGIGVVMLQTSGPANALSAGAFLPDFGDWRVLSLMSVVCLNYVGLELGAVLGDEIKDPRRAIPRAVLVAGITTVTLYLLATFALHVTIPAGEIGVIDGILQGVQRAVERLHMSWLVVPVAVLMSVNASGNAAAWLAGSSRIPFVIGLDRYLPPSLGRTHARYRTPHIALMVQAFASSLFIVISAIGSTVHDMYLVLLQTTVILQLIPYLYMFAALFRLQRHPGTATTGFFHRRWLLLVSAVVGFLMTAGGVLLAFVPATGITDVWNFELKTILGSLSFLIPALILYRRNLRKIKIGQPVPQTVEVQID